MKFIFFLFGLFPIFSWAQEPCKTDSLFTIENQDPFGITTDGSRIWVSNILSNIIYIFNLDGEIVNTITTEGKELGALAIQADTLWGISEQFRELNKVNRETGELYATYLLPFSENNPVDFNNFGVAFDGTYLWTTEYDVERDTSFIYKISPTDGQSLDTLIVPIKSLLPIVFVDSTLITVSFEDDKAYSIDQVTGQPSYLYDKCEEYPFDLAFHPDFCLISVVGFLSTDLSNTVYSIESTDCTLTNVKPLVNESLIQIYPNPGQHFVQIELPHMNYSTMRVFNSLGKEVLLQDITEHQFELQVNQWPTGLFYIHFSGDHHQEVVPFIKSK